MLNQIIGAKDALLMRINERLGLGLPLSDVSLGNINQKLSMAGKSSLLSSLNKLASQQDSWYWNLNELRNIGTHRALINIQAGVGMVENANKKGKSSSNVKVGFVVNPNKEIIPYLEDSIRDMKNLIEDILKHEPSLG